MSAYNVFPKIGGKQPLSEEQLSKVRDLNRNSLGPGNLALKEWFLRGLELPDLQAMNAYRLERTRDSLRKRKFAAAILMDPINIRYATDVTNMQVWVMHDPSRYALVFADGPLILFDYPDTAHLSLHNPLVNEVRIATLWDYFTGGEACSALAEKWAAELADLIGSQCGAGARVAVDRCGARGQTALRNRAIEVEDGMGPFEQARLIKGKEEIKAMRCALACCAVAMERLRARLKPGVTEQELWAVFQAENIVRGGEWIEARLFAAGPRTNPWYQECSSYRLQRGDWLSFDTDMIGPYGICADLSRTWMPDGVRPTPEQDRIFKMARDQVEHNIGLVRPGITFRELAEKSVSYPNDEYWRYGVLYHGVGMCDEYPGIPFPDGFSEPEFDAELEAGTVLCVESYVGRHGGLSGAKLEQQVLVTEDGYELLTDYPMDLL